MARPSIGASTALLILSAAVTAPPEPLSSCGIRVVAGRCYKCYGADDYSGGYQRPECHWFMTDEPAEDNSDYRIDIGVGRNPGSRYVLQQIDVRREADQGPESRQIKQSEQG